MKLFKVLLTVLLMSSILFVVSCKDKDNDKDKEQEQTPHTVHVDENKDGKCDECNENLVLACPTVTINEEGLATWTEVTNAASYIYKVNGSEMATKKTSLQLNDQDTIQVKAVANAPYTDSEYSAVQTYTAPVVIHYGLPELEEGYYMRDADVIQDGNVRYLIYTTNKTKANEDNVIAIRKGELTNDGWLYGDQKIILEASAEGWDQYLGSASIVAGKFALEGETYNYLIAYQGTTSSDNTANQIGFAVAKEIDGTYVKVGTTPVITYDAKVYGANMVGCYAPSLVNYTKESGIRLFYTLADAYGHFAYFADFDLSDLATIKCSKAMITNEGALQGGDAVTMFPNADFAYDDANQVFYAVKDVSPSPSVKPQYADEFELCHIAEAELYTTDKGDGWVSDVYKDFFDLSCDRCYSACIVSDMYGHLLEGSVTIIYNICTASNEYLYTQCFAEYTYAK